MGKNSTVDKIDLLTTNILNLQLKQFGYNKISCLS